MSNYKIIIALILIFKSCFVYAQITVEECYELAEKNYPQVKKASLIEKSYEYTISNANMGYVPKIIFSGRASYQSDVTKIPFDFPGIPTLSNDQYRIAVDVVQPLWDGGKISAEKSRIESEKKVEQDSLNVQLYSLKSRINQLFFGILLIDEQIKQNDIYIQDILRTYKTVENSIKNGVAKRSDLDRVKLEQIKAEQRKQQLLSAKKSYVILLEAITGRKIDGPLKRPEVYEPVDYTIYRPELKLFSSQSEMLESQKKMVKSSYMPVFDVFFTAGYGRPGFDMLQDTFQTYYIAGVQFQWPLMGFYTADKTNKLIDLNKMKINVDKETFLFNVNQDIAKQKNEIERIKKLIVYDNEIIELRRNIRKSSINAVKGGTMSVNDYMEEVSAEHMAVQTKILHEIELINAVYEMKNIINQ